ncbi:hypothetical protein FIBSPDRAFT_924524 [Athelia psychrophila]|uniref:Uncharacterized protein n=1 Tax=Athelia psychrophila TaxID=1759441 RepID=A0A166WA71_9AGAM|nr:hypothetical protein FIBSPDRAFT_924524 [Fibularhizoctonia sp. CBS 109695]
MCDQSPLNLCTICRDLVGNFWPACWYGPVVSAKPRIGLLVFSSIKDAPLPITTPVVQNVPNHSARPSSMHRFDEAQRRGQWQLLPLNKETDPLDSRLMSRSRRRHSLGGAFRWQWLLKLGQPSISNTRQHVQRGRERIRAVGSRIVETVQWNRVALDAGSSASSMRLVDAKCVFAGVCLKSQWSGGLPFNHKQELYSLACYACYVPRRQYRSCNTAGLNTYAAVSWLYQQGSQQQQSEKLTNPRYPFTYRISPS